MATLSTQTYPSSEKLERCYTVRYVPNHGDTSTPV